MSTIFINLNDVEQQMERENTMMVEESIDRPLPLNLAGLNMDECVQNIQCDVSTMWIIINDLGTIYQWRVRNRRFRKVNNMHGRNHNQLSTTTSEQLWNDFKSRMCENRFILITITGGHIILHYCHRRVMNVLPGQNILIFGPVSICFHNFADITSESFYQLERMRHLRLNGRGFKLRVQSNSHKLFICPNDIIDNRINFDWIQQLPISITTDDQCQQQNNNTNNEHESIIANQSIQIIHEDS